MLIIFHLKFLLFYILPLIKISRIYSPLFLLSHLMYLFYHLIILSNILNLLLTSNYYNQILKLLHLHLYNIMILNLDKHPNQMYPIIIDLFIYYSLNILIFMKMQYQLLFDILDFNYLNSNIFLKSKFFQQKHLLILLLYMHIHPWLYICCY